jgi:5-carboxymethyl-2-hydroxymuconate isomerase
MPHLTLEYTRNLQSKIEFKEIFSKIHEEIIGTGEFVPDDIKSRAICINNYFIGDGNPDKGFVHLRISLMDRRDENLKIKLSKALLQVLTNYLKVNTKGNKCQITVEVVNINSIFYSKEVL